MYLFVMRKQTREIIPRKEFCMEKLQNVKMKRMAALLTIFVFVLTMVTTRETYRVSAEDENLGTTDTATVSAVWATFPAEGVEGEPCDFEVSESQPGEKGLFAKYISNGTFTMKEEDDGLIVWVNNAEVICNGGIPCEYKLSGNSKLALGSYNIISTSDRIPACNINVATEDAIGAGDALLAFYNSASYDGSGEGENYIPGYSYDYEIVSNTTWTGWTNMNSLTVNAGATLSIACGHDYEGNYDFTSCINAKSVILNGTINIVNSSVTDTDDQGNPFYNDQGTPLYIPNQFAIEGGGSLSLGGSGRLISDGNGIVELRENVTVSGIDFYEADRDTTITFDGTADGCFRFFYDGEASKWIHEAGQEDDSAVINIVDSRGATVTYKSDSGEYTGFPEGMRLRTADVASAQTITVRFASGENQNITGIQIFYRVDDVDHFDYVHLNGNNEYTFSANEDGNWNYYEVWVIDWDICMDNEYKLVSFLGDNVSFKVNNTQTERETVNSFVSGTPLTLEATASNYVYVIRENNKPDTALQSVQGNSFTYTPNSKNGFEICLYPSEDAYNYYSLGPTEDGEYEVEFFVRNETETESTVSFTPEPIRQGLYDGRTKLIFSGEKTIEFTISAAEGIQYEVRLNGEDKTSDVTPEGQYNWQVSQENCGCLDIRFYEDPGQNPGEDPGQDPGQNPGQEPDHTVTAGDAVAAVESHLIAYAPAGEKTVAQLASDEIWNVFFGTITDSQGHVRHVGDFSSFFADRDAFNSAISIESEPSTVNSEITKPGTSDKLPYLAFTLTVTDGAIATGRIYVLESEYDMIVRTVKGSSTSYQLITANPYNETANTGCDAFHPYVMTCEYDMDNEGWPLVEVFGNGASFINISDSGNKAQCFGGHITGEQSGYSACKLSYKLEIYNSSFEGVKVTGNGGDTADGGQGLAAAWSWFAMDTIATNGTTASNPVAYNIFAGNTKIYLDSVSTLGSQKKITSVTCSLPAAERAVKITQSGDRFIAEPLSTFYTVLPLAVTYEGGATGYITINIVAMDIQDNTSPGGSNSIIINHGTDRDYSFDCPDRNAITATFYYTKDIDPATTGVNAILEATYTWKDGTVTRNTITEKVNSESWAGTSEPNKVTADDFILWQGSADNKPVKIEVIALKPDSAADAFAGALFGGGAGITWTKH